MMNNVRHQLLRRSLVRGNEQSFSEAQLLHGVVCVVLGGAMFFTVLTVVFVPFHPLWLVFSSGLIVALALMVYCSRSGWNTLAKYGTCFSLWLFDSLAIAFDGGIHSPLMSCYLLVIACSSFWFSRRDNLLFVALILLSSIGFVLAEIFASLPNTSLIGNTTLGGFLTFSCVLVVFSALMLYSQSSLRSAINHNQQLQQQQLQTETALKANEQRYRRIAELSSDFSFAYEPLADGTSNLIWGTEAIVRISGYTHAELHSTNSWDMITHPDDLHILEQHRKNLRAGSSDVSEFRILSKAGRTRWLRITAHPEFDEQQKNLVQIYGVMQDLTVVKRLEQQLSQAQKLESVGRLAGGVAHDFNNMLTVILGNCSLMLDTLEEDHPLYSDIEHIRFAAERASGLSKQLLSFSRRQVLQPSLVNINESIISTTRLLSRLLAKDHKLETDLAENVGCIKIDPGQLDQVLINLTVNARDAMNEGGTLQISTRTIQIHHHNLDNFELAPGKYVVLQVRDTGCGMDKATQAHAFEPFFTTKAVGQGTGLGLATVQSIVRQYHGSINITSELGKGTQIEILLPQSEQRI